MHVQRTRNKEMIREYTYARFLFPFLSFVRGGCGLGGCGWERRAGREKREVIGVLQPGTSAVCQSFVSRPYAINIRKIAHDPLRALGLS